MAENEQNGTPRAEPPHSIEPASVDDKGRLKLPAKVVEYLNATGVTEVFISTTDLRQVTIYPLSVWQRNEELFENPGDDVEAAERLALLMKHYGGDSAIDPSGRVLLPAPLRQELGLEKQSVVVQFQGGCFNVRSRKVHEEQLQVSRASLAQDSSLLKKRGLK